jgi:hypothetical protein
MNTKSKGENMQKETKEIFETDISLKPLETLLKRIERVLDKNKCPLDSNHGDKYDWFSMKYDFYGFLDQLTSKEINDNLNILIKRFIARNENKNELMYRKYCRSNKISFKDLYILIIRDYIRERRISPSDKVTCYTGLSQEDKFNKIKLEGFLEKLWMPREVKEDARKNN